MAEEPAAETDPHPIESILHWKALRERLEPQIQRLESELRGFRWERASAVGNDAAERRYERLLRLRRVRAKLASRERHAAATLGE